MAGGRPRRAPSSSLYDDVARRSSAVIIDRYSTSFGWATRLLGEPDRTHVRCIYALVRVADELVDDDRQPWAPQARGAMLSELQADVHRAVEVGGSPNLVVHAFALTARQYGIGRDLIDPFFDSMRADLSVTEHTGESHARYLYGSAEVVGLMCLRVFVAGDDDLYDRLAPAAQRLGAAFQNVNFMRDLARDRKDLGRTYFAGVDAEHLTEAEKDRILDDVDADLAAAALAIAELPRRSRRAVGAAHGLFEELSRRLRATPAEQVLTTRVRVPNPVKAKIIARTMMGAQ